MRKRTIATIVLAVCIATFVSAQNVNNEQKIYSIDSPVYEALTQLYISEGLALPSTTGPWSENELILMLDRIDESSLNSVEDITYDFIYETLHMDDKAVDFGLDINLEGYYHTNTTDFTMPDDWIYTYEDRAPLLDIVLETSLSEHFYGYSSLTVTSAQYEDATNTDGPITNAYGENAFTSNIFLIQTLSSGAAGFSNLDLGMPYRAFGAFGGDGWSVQVGREQLSWGPGISGNFILGDHLQYHNTARVTTYSDNFKYTFLTSFFPYPGEYYNSGPYAYGGYVDYENSQNDEIEGINMFMGHRLEWRFFDQKVNFVVTESIMYQSEDGILDLRVLSPTTIFHDYYIRANANSLLSLELDITPIDHINVYGQLVVDEFSLPGEPVAGESGANPRAMGYMAGVQASYPVAEGFVYGSLEGVLTDPYLYLRGGTSDQSLGDYGINYVVAIRQYMAGGIYYDESFLGYEYGGDAIVLNGQVGYKEFGKWHATANVFYMMHGTHDMWTLWEKEDGSNGTSEQTTPTTEHVTDNNLDDDVSDRDSVETTLVIGVQGGYTIVPGFDVFAQLDFVNITNPGNVSTNADQQDIQLTVGVSYEL